jgi:hypothetical protein
MELHDANICSKFSFMVPSKRSCRSLKSYRKRSSVRTEAKNAAAPQNSSSSFDVRLKQKMPRSKRLGIGDMSDVDEGIAEMFRTWGKVCRPTEEMMADVEYDTRIPRSAIFLLTNEQFPLGELVTTSSCTRCRLPNLKRFCDRALPKCGPCMKSNVECVRSDSNHRKLRKKICKKPKLRKRERSPSPSGNR